MNGVLITGGGKTQAQKHEGSRPYDDRGIDGSAAATSQGMPRIPCIPVPVKVIPMSFIPPETRRRQERILS